MECNVALVWRPAEQLILNFALLAQVESESTCDANANANIDADADVDANADADVNGRQDTNSDRALSLSQPPAMRSHFPLFHTHLSAMSIVVRIRSLRFR